MEKRKKWIFRKIRLQTYIFEAEDGSEKTQNFSYRLVGYRLLDGLLDDERISSVNWLSLLDELFLQPMPNIPPRFIENKDGLYSECNFLDEVEENKILIQESIVINSLPNCPCFLDDFEIEGTSFIYYENENQVEDSEDDEGPCFSPPFFSKTEAHIWLNKYASVYGFDSFAVIRLREDIEKSSLPNVKYIKYEKCFTNVTYSN